MLAALLLLASVIIQNAPTHIPSGIGIWENKVDTDKWLVCKEKELPVMIVDMYFEAGMKTASDTWDKAIKTGDCLAIQGWMMPQALEYRRRIDYGSNSTTLRVVRVADKDNKEYFWFTIDEPVIGEPPFK